MVLHRYEMHNIRSYCLSAIILTWRFGHFQSKISTYTLFKKELWKYVSIFGNLWPFHQLNVCQSVFVIASSLKCHEADEMFILD